MNKTLLSTSPSPTSGEHLTPDEPAFHPRARAERYLTPMPSEPLTPVAQRGHATGRAVSKPSPC